MPRRSFQIAAAIILVLAALTPLMECFDHWDKYPGPGNDTEIHLTAWFAGAGLVLTLGKLLRYVPAFVRTGTDPDRSCRDSRVPRLEPGDRLEPTESPPLLPLRI